jgi:3-hydroxyisobutyrate dehydrogenase-like beta-hydroxyacid dehydrogenase
MTAHIGFIGIGLMGHGMAGNLLAKGYPVTGMAHRNRAPLEDLLGKGAKEAASPREIAEAADVVILCVTGAPEVESIVYRTDGLLEGVSSGMTVIDCSTSEPDMTERVAADLAAKGVAMADAPLARTPIEAEAGKLNTMVGAPDELFAAIRPILETFCENIFHVGNTGAGHKTKLINNFLAMGHGALIGEAMVACAATGVDIGKFYEVVSAGGANSGIFQLIVPKAMDEGDFSGLKFSLANAAKDLRYYTRMTELARLTGELGKAVRDAYVLGLEAGYAEGYVGDLIRAQAKINDIGMLEDGLPSATRGAAEVQK